MELTVPRPLYYFLATTITQFVLAVAAILLLLPIGLLGRLPLSAITPLLAYNIIVATLLAVVLTNNSAENKTPVLKGGGLVLGHLVGLLLGGFVGLRYGGTVAAIIGAVLGYFVLGWLGSGLCLLVGRELDWLTHASTENGAEKLLHAAARRKVNSLFIYGGVIPALFLVVAIFIRNSGFLVAQYAQVLPVARIVLVALSVLSILVPWLRRLRPAARTPAGTGLSIAGLGLSLSPAIFGFLLFWAFGLSIVELSLFAIVAAIATTIWAVRAAGS